MTEKTKAVLYIGTKCISALPMSRGEYNQYRGWAPPPGEEQEVEGYLVEYLDGGEANDDRHHGYISWSPRDVFEAAYKPSGELGFGQMLELLRVGYSCERRGWNGKGMFIYLVGEGRYPPSTPAGIAIAMGQSDGLVPYRPYIAMSTVTGEVVPWVASQTDLLATDWQFVSPMDVPA